ncbi:hypothetical protein ES703_21006 [subsurface metagenome]
MAEPIIEQIAAAIETAIDGKQDPDTTLTLRAVRPKILDWITADFKHGDVVIEARTSATQEEEKTTSSRLELGSWMLYGIITTLPADTAADTMLHRMAETIRRILLAENDEDQVFSGLAFDIECPLVNYEVMSGGVVAEVTVQVRYDTALADGYAAPS